jgi:hypothetical protein
VLVFVALRINRFVRVVLLVWICGVSFETLKWCHADRLLGYLGMNSVRQVNTEGVETIVELVAVLDVGGVKIGWALVKRELRVIILVEDLRGEGLVC